MTTAIPVAPPPQAPPGCDRVGLAAADAARSGPTPVAHRHPLEQDPKLSLLFSHLRGPHPLEQLDVEHHGFTDFVVFNPEASLADPALGAVLESHFATGVDSVAAGTAALTAQRRFLTAFMRRYLKLCHDDGRASRRLTGSHAARSSRCRDG